MALRIVDQFRESQLLFLGEIIPKGLLDLCLDDTGTASQHMDECLMFSVKIREEVFRSLGHAAEGPKIDDLCSSFFRRRIFMAQQGQIIKISHKVTSVR